MLILALDTSGKSLSVALARDEEPIAQCTLSIGLKHSATALPMIHDLCDRCGVTQNDIDAYACAIGPGSYTGIRIGVSLIKGLSYANRKPAVGVSTLAALAKAVQGTDDTSIIIPMIDARSGRFFSCAQCGPQLLVPEGNRHQLELAELLKDILSGRPTGERKLLLIGDGASGYAKTDDWPGAEAVLDAGPAFRWPSALVVALMAREKLMSGGDFSPFLLEASYLSPSQAERMRRHHE